MVSKKISNLKNMVSAIDTKMGKLVHARARLLDQISDLQDRADSLVMPSTVETVSQVHSVARATPSMSNQSAAGMAPSMATSVFTGSSYTKSAFTRPEIGVMDQYIHQFIEACQVWDIKSGERALSALSIMSDKLAVNASLVGSKALLALRTNWAVVLGTVRDFEDAFPWVEATFRALNNLEG